MKIQNLFAIAIVAIVTTVTYDACHAQLATLEALPPTGGLKDSYANGVSANGSVVVGESIGGGPISYPSATRWFAGNPTPLGTLDPNGIVNNTAYATSADGHIVVGMDQSDRKHVGVEGFRWQNGAMVSLSDPSQGINFESANGISDDGSVICGDVLFKKFTEAVRLENGVTTVLPAPDRKTTATAVSADGGAIIGYTDSGAAVKYKYGVFDGSAVLWINGQTIILGDLPGGLFGSRPQAVSADGSVVVGGSVSHNPYHSYGQVEAFRWENGLMEPLGYLPKAAKVPYSEAMDVTADGSMIVGTSDNRAFIWDSVNGMRDLAKVLQTDYGVDLRVENGAATKVGWKLLEATGVSDDGLIIVGNGISPSGRIRAWKVILAPPNNAPEVTRPVSQTAECVAGGATFDISIDVFDADGDDLTITWDIRHADGTTQQITDTVTFTDPPVTTTVTLGGGDFLLYHGTSLVRASVSDGTTSIPGKYVKFIVEDTVAPVLVSGETEFNDIPNDEGTDYATIVIADYAPVFEDACSPTVTATHDQATPTVQFLIGEHEIVWTINDGHGNTTEFRQTFTVVDAEKPSGTAPADIEVAHDYGESYASNVLLGEPTDVADNYDDVADLIITNDAPAEFPVGVTLVTWTIIDTSNNFVKLEQFVTVTNEAPVANAGDDMTVECAGATTQVPLNGVASYDNDDSLESLDIQWSGTDVTFDDPTSLTPIATVGHGSFTVTLTITDPSGDSDSADVFIIVEDTTAPQIQAAKVDQSVLWPPKHDMVPVFLDLLVSDTCVSPENLIIACTIDSNEADDANGDGAFTGDVNGEDGHTQGVDFNQFSYNSETGKWEGTIFLRAERDGGGDGRKYSIRCMAMDASGNMTYATVCVTVPKSMGKKK